MKIEIEIKTEYGKLVRCDVLNRFACENALIEMACDEYRYTDLGDLKAFMHGDLNIPLISLCDFAQTVSSNPLVFWVLGGMLKGSDTHAGIRRSFPMSILGEYNRLTHWGLYTDLGAAAIQMNLLMLDSRARGTQRAMMMRHFNHEGMLKELIDGGDYLTIKTSIDSHDGVPIEVRRMEEESRIRPGLPCEEGSFWLFGSAKHFTRPNHIDS